MKSMNRWKVAALGLALLACAWALPSVSQMVNRITGPGILDWAGAAYVDNDGQVNTYSATVNGMAPAASATDIACLGGSSTKTVKVTQVVVSGTAATLATVPVSLRFNTSLDSAGTSVTGSVYPVAYKHQSSQAAPTAIPSAWTTNPTINDSAPGVLGAMVLTVPISTSTVAASRAVWAFGGRGGAKAPVLSGTAQQLCVNLGSTTISSGVIYVSFEWTEE